MSAAVVLAKGRVLIKAGDLPQALALLEAEQPNHPRDADLALLLADVLQASGQLQRAVAAYAVGLALNESAADGWYGSGCAYMTMNAAGDAARCFSQAAELAPQSGPVLYNLGTALFTLGRIEDALAAFERAEHLDPEVAELARASIACIIPGSPVADHAAVQRARRRWADIQLAGIKPFAPGPARPPDRKLRVGYLSAFFGEPNWMKPVFALINQHDRSAFEIFMWSDGKPPSADSGYRDYDFDYVCDLRGIPNKRAASIIADAGMDILVDLNGYSFQQRLGMLMHRPAPHIVGWFNMFATTGIGAFDWLIGDDAVIHADEERFFNERIHRVPGSYLAFEVLYHVPDIAPPPCVTAGAITFGCLGSQYKLTDQVLASWAEILVAAPRSRLFIKNAGLEDVSTRNDLLSRLTGLGISADRVTLEGRSPHFAFLDAYRHVDIALDTFPYNGGTTTTEALWQGVPVLTFDGDRWASRTSKSLLHAAGLSDWVMPDLAGYTARGVALANNAETPAALAHLRSNMRPRLTGSAACDSAGLCRAMENFYQSIVGPPQ